jgi:Tol biopolymer transport system component
MMDELRGKILRWILAGGAFFAVLGTCGCSSDVPAVVAPDSDSMQANAHPAVLSPVLPPTDSSVLLTSADSSKPSGVNIFGELDGVERNPGHPHGNGGFQQHTFLDEGFDSDVNLDPTGKWMLFTSTRHSDHPNIYLQKVDGLSVIQLTDDDADYAYPVFSPDAKLIAFCSTRSGNWDIYVMDADGKNCVQVTNGPMQYVHPTFSPDGSKLAYSCLGGKSGQWELWTVDLASGEKRMIGFGLFPSWSPAKGVDKIAFQRARQRGSRWFSLWTLDLVDGANAAIVSPCWSPDGAKLAFATIAQPSNSSGAKPLGQQDIWTVNCDGANRRRLTDGVGLNLAPCWASDNRVYFISDRAGPECVWSVHAEDAKTPNLADKPHGTDAVGSTN